MNTFEREDDDLQVKNDDIVVSTTANGGDNLGLGILNFDDVVVENRKGFKPREELGGLTIAKINSVKVVPYTVDKFDKDGRQSNYYYAGLELPRLEIELIQRPTAQDPAERFYKDKFSIVAPYKNDGTAIDKEVYLRMIKQQYAAMKHYNNAITTLAGFKPWNSALDLNGSKEQVVKNYTKWFQSLADSFNSVNLNDNWFWFKVIANISNTGKPFFGTPRNAGYDSIIVGEGFIQLYVDKKPTSLEIKPNESIVLPKITDNGGKGRTKSYNDASVNDDLPSASPINSSVQSILSKYENIGK